MTSESSETSDRPFPISSALIETVGWVTAAIGLTLAAAAIVLGPWDHDGGLFLLRGSYIAEGVKPYIDYHTMYPPLVEILTAFAVRTGASRLFLAIGVPFAWILANAIASGLLAWTVTRSHSVATLIGALFPLFAADNGGNHLTLELGVSFFTLLAIACVAGTPALTPRRLALCSVCAAAAMLSKQTGAIALLPVAAILYSRRSEVSRGTIAAFFAGMVSLPLAILAWLRFNVAAIYDNVVTLLGNYAASSPPTIPGWKHEFVYPTSAFLDVIAIVCGLAVVVYVPRWRLLAGAGLVAVVIEAIPRIVRDYRHYNINMWPFMVLLLALAAAQANENRRAAVIAVLLIFATATSLREIGNVQSGESALVRLFVPAAEAVESVTPANGVVRQYGTEPIIEFLASRREEQIDKLRRVPAAPPDAATVVVVDDGQPWVSPLILDLKARSFRPVAQVGTRPQISVFRKQ